MKHYTKNDFSVIGRLTQDATIRKTKGEKPVSVTNIDLALSVGKDEETTFINNISVWGQQADFVGAHAPKGTLVLVEGRIETEVLKADDKNYTVLSLVANRVQILDKPNTND